MMILGPLVAPSTSTVTDALSRPVLVTVSPSTAMTTGRLIDSPTAVETLSISMTSPTATFCCLAPARTIAYTAVSFVDLSLTSWSGAVERTRTILGLFWIERRAGLPHRERHAQAHRGSIVRIGPGHRKTVTGPGVLQGWRAPQRLREPFFLIGTCSTGWLSSDGSASVWAPVSATAVPGSTTPWAGGAPTLPELPLGIAGAEAIAGTSPSSAAAPEGGPAGRLALRPR